GQILSATALTKNDVGTWSLGGSLANATGANTINAGTLILAKTAAVAAITGNVAIGDGNGGQGADVLQIGTNNNGQIPSTSVVTINQSSGKLDLNENSQSIAALADATTQPAGTLGQVTLGAGTLTLIPTTAQVYSGTISGTGGLVLGTGATSS